MLLPGDRTSPRLARPARAVSILTPGRSRSDLAAISYPSCCCGCRCVTVTGQICGKVMMVEVAEVSNPMLRPVDGVAHSSSSRVAREHQRPGRVAGRCRASP